MSFNVKKLNELDIGIEKIKDKNRNPIYLILDNIRSAYNVGAAFRTSDAGVLKKIYLCGITAFLRVPFQKTYYR